MVGGGVPDDDLRALRSRLIQPPSVNLPQRRSGERPRLELLEQILRIGPQLPEELLADERVVHGRRLEVEMGENGDVLRREDLRPRRRRCPVWCAYT